MRKSFLASEADLKNIELFKERGYVTTSEIIRAGIRCLAEKELGAKL